MDLLYTMSRREVSLNEQIRIKGLQISVIMLFNEIRSKGIPTDSVVQFSLRLLNDELRNNKKRVMRNGR